MRVGWLILLFAGTGLAQRMIFQFDTRSGDYQLGPDGSVQYTGAAAMPAPLGTVTVSSGTTTVNGQTIPRGMQIWTVGTTGWYDVVAGGASGSDLLKLSGSLNGGRGVAVKSRYYLSAGTRLAILVGMKPTGCVSSGFWGGGGGSFVSVFAGSAAFSTSTQHTLVLAAGGGGSVSSWPNGVGTTGVSATTGTSGLKCGNNPATAVSSAGGGGGGGGLAGSSGTSKGSSGNSAGVSAGGAGFLGDGGDGYTAAAEKTRGGKAFIAGGTGGISYEVVRTTNACSVSGIPSPGLDKPPGGFGGGGGGWNAAGGGGGYSGGQGCAYGTSAGGGGGGSYDWSGAGNAGTLYSTWDTSMFGTAPSGYASGYMSGDGRVAISLANSVPVFAIIGQNNVGTLRKVDLGTRTVSSLTFTEALGNVGAAAISPDGTFALVPNCAKNVIQGVVFGPETTSLLAGTTVGSRIDGTGTNAGFRCPRAMAIYPDNSYALIADRDNNAIRKLDLTSLAVTTVAGTCSGTTACTVGMTNGATALASTLGSPQGIAIHPDGASAYVADNTYCLIRKLVLAATVTISTIAGTGTCVSTAPSGFGTSVGLGGMPTIRISPGGGSLVFPDRNAKKMRFMDLSTLAVSNAISVAVSDLLDGDLMGLQTSFLCVDYGASKVHRITYPGEVLTTIVGSGTLGSADGIGTSATFNTPITVTVWRCSIPGYGIVTSDSVCERCPAGTYSSRGEVCLACPSGMYSSGIGASSCTACPVNTRPNRVFTVCIANAGYFIGSSGVQFPPSPFMTGDTFTSGGETFTASASSFYSPTNEAAWRAFSGVSTSVAAGSNVNAWTSNAGFYSGSSSGAYTDTASTTVDGAVIRGEWLQLQSTVQHILGSFSITTCYLNPTRAPKSFVLAGSNDGVTWISLQEVSGEATWTASQVRTYTMPEAVAMSYFRLIVTNTTGTSDTYLTIDKLRLFDAQVSTCAGTCGSGTKFCSPNGASFVCCAANQYFIPGISTACTTCPANSAADTVYQERCMANAGFFGPSLYMFDGSTPTYQNMGSRTSHTVTAVGWRPTFGTVVSRFGAYFESSVHGNYYTVSNDYNTITLAFWLYLSLAYDTTKQFQFDPMSMQVTGNGFNFDLGSFPSSGMGFFYVCYASGCANAQTAAGTFPASSWLHVVLVLPNSPSVRQQKVFVNGVLRGTRSDTATQDFLSNFQRLLLAANVIESRYYRGYLQQVTMYNYAMLDAEAIALYNSGTPLVFVPCTGTCSAGLVKQCLRTGAMVCCPPGTFFRGEMDTTCQACPAGTYSGTSASSCTLCPAGTFSLNPSQILLSACVSCPTGSTSNDTRTGCVANAGFYNLDSNLLAYYPFRPDSVYTDASWSGYGLTDMNGVSYKPQTDFISGPFPGAGTVLFNNPGVSFAGVSIPSASSNTFRVSVGAGLNLHSLIGTGGSPSAGFTLCFWMRGADGATAGVLNSINAQNVFTFMTASSSPTSRLRLITVASGNSVAMDNLVNSVAAGSSSYTGKYTRLWSHQCFSMQGTTFKAYFDCSSASCSSSDTTLSTSFSSSVLYTFVTIGQGGWDTAYYGWLSDVRLYKEALTPAEVFAVRSYTGATSFSVNGDPSLLAYYPFNSSSTLYADASGNGYTLVDTNAGRSPVFDSTTGPFPGVGSVYMDNNNIAATAGTAKTFRIQAGSGFNLRAMIGTSGTPASGFSVCFWYRAVSNTIHYINGFSLGYTGTTPQTSYIRWIRNAVTSDMYWTVVGSGSIYMDMAGTGQYSTSWRHVCFTASGRSWLAYYDCGSSTCSSLSVTASNDIPNILYDRVYIGQHFWDWAWYGWFSEVRLYRKALSAAEVFSIRSFTGVTQPVVTSPDLALLAYYPFKQADIFADASGNGYTLTATNAGSPPVSDGSSTGPFTGAGVVSLNNNNVLATASTARSFTITMGAGFNLGAMFGTQSAPNSGFSFCGWYKARDGATPGQVNTVNHYQALFSIMSHSYLTTPSYNILRYFSVYRDGVTSGMTTAVRFNDPAITADSTLTTAGKYQNIWTHYCAAGLGRTVNVYYDCLTRTCTPVVLTLSNDVVNTQYQFGYIGADYDPPWHGWLSEFRLYKRALTAAEVFVIRSYDGTSETAVNSVNAGLLAYYPFHPNAFLLDASGVTGALTNIGTVVSQAGSLTDLQNVAYLAQASGLGNANANRQFLTIPQITIGPSSSICLWYNPDSVTGQYSRLIDLNTGANSGHIDIRREVSTSNLAIEVWNGATSIVSQAGCTASAAGASSGCVFAGMFQLGVWQHMCLTITGTTGRVYYNGALQSPLLTLTAQKAISTYTTSWMGQNPYSNELYRGQLDEVRIYSRAISASEVTSIFNFRGDTYTPAIILPCPNPCTAGSYGGCTSDGTATCTSCPAGTFSTGIGMVSSATCVSCAAGTYFAGGACTNCPAGTYSGTTGASLSSVCILCLAGTFSTASGATAVQTCSGCLAGTFSGTAGLGSASSCQNCLAGTYSGVTGLTAATSCLNCPAGTYSGTTGLTAATSCLNCAAGTYSGTSGLSAATSCLNCPAGTYSGTAGLTAATSCLNCPAGTYSGTSGLSAVTSCLNCPAGTYSGTSGLTAATSCLNCPAGRYSGTSGLTAATSCLNCPAGTYSGTSGLTAATSCLNCPTGTYSGTPGLTAATSCLNCPAGTYSGTSGLTAATSCQNCAAGTYSGTPGLTSATSCQNCPAGTFSGTSGLTAATSCQNCPTGKYSATAGSTTSTACQDCATGTYSVTAGLTSATSCTACAAGTFSGTTGASSATNCQSCAAGSFSSSTGLSVCTACIAGTYLAGTGGTSSSQCIQCQAGTFSAVVGAASSLTCTACSAGKFSGTAGVSTSSACQACSNGFFSLASASACSACLAGTYGGGVGVSVCPACGSGQVSTGSGQLNCATCVAGTYSDSGRSACLMCKAATYSSVVGAISSSVCTFCVPGTYSSASGATSISTCTLCGAGKYSYGVFDWDFNNQVGDVNVSFCLPCAAGTYSDVLGRINICDFCPRGTYNGLTGSSSLSACIGCSAGSFSGTVGATMSGTCEACAAGSYSTSVGLSSHTSLWLMKVYAASVPLTGAGVVDSQISLVGEAYVPYIDFQSLAAFQAVVPATPATNFIVLFQSYGYINVSGMHSFCLDSDDGSAISYYSSNYNIHARRKMCFDGYLYQGAEANTPATSAFASVSYFQATGEAFMRCTYSGPDTGGQEILYRKRYLPEPCTPCSAGSYMSALGGTACVLCPSGKFVALTGSTSSAACIQCAAGTFLAQPQQICTPCSAGTYREDLSGDGLSCLACIAGSYSTASGASSSSTCIACGAGTYSVTAGATQADTCTRCVAGTYSTALGAGLASTCQSCLAGLYSTSLGATIASTCLQCQAGRYFTGTGLQASGSCTACLAGTFSTALAASTASTCQSCQAGTFQTGTGMQSSLACTACSAGFYATGTGFTLASNCVACAAGTFSATTGASLASVCLFCSAGKYSGTTGASSSLVCTACSAGYYATGTGFTSVLNCLACAAGTYSATTGASLASVCLSCSAGRYSGTTGASSSLVCTACSAGYYATGTGFTSVLNCLACAAGTYSASTGASLASVCLSCSAGKYSGNVGAGSETFCLACNAGFYATGTGLTTATNCLACAAGTYGLTISLTICTSCTAGTYSTATGTSVASTCVSCSAGTYSGTTGASVASACQACSAGRYSTVVGATIASTCQLCSAGTYFTGTGLAASGSCTSCLAGLYSTASGATIASTCQLCSAGTYSTGTGLQVSGSCAACSTGVYSTASGAVTSSTCQSCLAGTFQSGTGLPTSAACTSCSAGLFSLLGASSCTACLPGTFSGTPGSTGCTACNPGFYSTAFGLATVNACIACGAGTFSQDTGASSSAACTPCFTGKYGGTGVTLCLDCASGTFASSTGSSTCTTCSPGTYMLAVVGASSSGSCLACVPGTYSTNQGAVGIQTCQPCSAGTYSTVPAAASPQTCQACLAGTYSTGLGAFGVPGIQQVALAFQVLYPEFLADPFLLGNAASYVYVAKGATVRFYSSGDSRLNALHLFNRLHNSAVFFTSNVDDIIPRSGSMTSASQAVFNVSGDVTGTGTSILTWDTSNAPSGMYFVAPKLTTIFYHLSVFVASASPTTIVYEPSLISSNYLYKTVVGACLGDTVELRKPVGASKYTALPIKDLFITCMDGVDRTVLVSGPPPLIWLVGGIPANQVCLVSYGSLAGDYDWYSLIKIFPRPSSPGSTVAMASPCISCLPGTFSTASGAPSSSTCVACQSGTYMTQEGGTVCTDCPSSSTTNTTGKSQRGDCVCNAGFVGDLSVLGQTCSVCPANSYCAGLSQTACPSNTRSPAQSSLPVQCRCVAGFKCSYRRDVTLDIRFNMDLPDFNAQASSIRSKLASAADVPVGNVTLVDLSRILILVPGPAPSPGPAPGPSPSSNL